MKLGLLAASSLLVVHASDLQAQRITIAPTKPKPGAVVRITLRDALPPGDRVLSVSGALAGEPLHFIKSSEGTWHAIGAVPVDAQGRLVARAELSLSSGRTDTIRATLTLPPTPAPVAQPLSVDTRFTQPLDSATQARVDRENARAREVGRQVHDSPPRWTASFLRPRSSIITSEFGSGRLFNGELTARHLGVDFRGAMGEPVRAANRGVVALVDNFFLAGNVVYIDHGGGVVTAYFHLSKTLVHKGDSVKRGQTIGLVGNTGRVTGPHLHWAARYGAITINPLDLLSLDRRWYGASVTATTAAR